MKNLSMFGRQYVNRFFRSQIMLVLALGWATQIFAQEAMKKDPDVIGRWDLTIEKDGKAIPSWLEVQKSGTHTLIGRFCYAFGSARPISEVKDQMGKYAFSIPPQWEDGKANMDFQFEVSGNQISGTMVYIDGQTYHWTGVRAPELIRSKKPVWGAPVKLFNGINTKGWHTDGEKNQWIAVFGFFCCLF